MALVWIKRVENRSNLTFILRQNDPSWHPVIHQASNVTLPDTPGGMNAGVQVQNDQRIVVGANGSLSCDYFVIPWDGKGRLLVEAARSGDQAPKTGISAVVGPAPHDDSMDYLLQSGPANLPPIPMGDRGIGHNVELSLIIDPRADGVGEIRFEPTNRNSLPVAKELEKLFWKAVEDAGKALWEMVRKSMGAPKNEAAVD